MGQKIRTALAFTNCAPNGGMHARCATTRTTNATFTIGTPFSKGDFRQQGLGVSAVPTFPPPPAAHAIRLRGARHDACTKPSQRIDAMNDDANYVAPSPLWV